MKRILPASPALLVPVSVVLHLLLYAPGLSGGFTFDDGKIVCGRDDVSGKAPLSRVLFREYFPKPRAVEGIDYRPLTLLSLGLDVRLFGPSAGALRSENALLAGAGAGLFACLVASLGAAPVVAWGTLLLLACHPVRSEAVLSVVGRSELLSFALVCGALLLALRALRGTRGASAPSALLFAAALFAKENAFAAPGLLLLVGFLERRRAAPDRRGAAFVAAGWGLALLGAFAVRIAVLGGPMTGPLARLDPFDNLLAGLPAAGRIGAALALLPLAALRLVWPAALVADYGSAAFAARDLLAPAVVVPGALLLACALLLAAALLARGSLAGLGLAWALASYLPFANLLFPTGTAFAERLLYAPAAGAALALATGLARGGRAGIAATALLAALGAARIEARIPEWRDDRALFSAVVRDVPGNGRAWLDLALLSLSEGNAGRARGEIAAALRADPRLLSAAGALVRHAEATGQREAAAALRAAIGEALPGQ